MSEATQTAAETQEPNGDKPTTAKKTVYTTIQMKVPEGSPPRSVEFPGDTKLRTEILPPPDENGNISEDAQVRFDFRTGDSFTAGLNHGGLFYRYAAHGLMQKLRDEGSGEKEPDDFYEAVRALYDRLADGRWSEQRAGGSGGFAGASVLVRAIAEAKQKSTDEIRQFLKQLTDGKDAREARAIRLALRNHPTIKPIADRIDSEKQSTSGIDSNQLLSTLG